MLAFIFSSSALAIDIVTSATLPDAIIGEAYEHQFLADGKVPFRWILAAGSLPDGMTLSEAGILRGVPTVVSTNNFRLRVLDDDLAEAFKDFTLTITLPYNRPQIVWTGAGRDGSWHNSENWDLGRVPVSEDVVLLNSPVRITNSVTIAALYFFSAGQLIVRGSSIEVACLEESQIWRGSLVAEAGGVLSFPGLKRVRIMSEVSGSVYPSSWEARGSGSVIDFPALEELEGNLLAGVTYRSHLIRARDGGLIRFGALASLTVGTVDLSGIGAESRLEFPVLTELHSEHGSISAENGCLLSFPALRRYWVGSVLSSSIHPTLWDAVGAGSVINFPALEELEGNLLAGVTYRSHLIRARDGGSIFLPALSEIRRGTVEIVADGIGSRVAVAEYFLVRNAALTGVSLGDAAEVVSAEINTGSLTLFGRAGEGYAVQARLPGGETWRTIERIGLSDSPVELRIAPRLVASFELKVIRIGDPNPELDLRAEPGGVLLLTLFGRPGADYILKTAPDLGDADAWNDWQSLRLENAFIQVPLSSVADVQYVRAVQGKIE